MVHIVSYAQPASQIYTSPDKFRDQFAAEHGFTYGLRISSTYVLVACRHLILLQEKSAR
jgi:hypothetical protein